MIDYQTLADDTITIRHRDSMQQDRVAVAQVASFLSRANLENHYFRDARRLSVRRLDRDDVVGRAVDLPPQLPAQIQHAIGASYNKELASEVLIRFRARSSRSGCRAAALSLKALDTRYLRSKRHSP